MDFSWFYIYCLSTVRKIWYLKTHVCHIPTVNMIPTPAALHKTWNKEMANGSFQSTKTQHFPSVTIICLSQPDHMCQLFSLFVATTHRSQTFATQNSSRGNTSRTFTATYLAFVVVCDVKHCYQHN